MVDMFSDAWWLAESGSFRPRWTSLTKPTKKLPPTMIVAATNAAAAANARLIHESVRTDPPGSGFTARACCDSSTQFKARCEACGEVLPGKKS